MKKLTFPKGSLKFKIIKHKTQEFFEVNNNGLLKKYIMLREFNNKFNDSFKKTGKNSYKEHVPENFRNPIIEVNHNLSSMRRDIKKGNSFSLIHEYEITFRHPKWSKLIGDITLTSNKNCIRESLELIVKKFKVLKAEKRALRLKNKINTVKGDEICYKVSGGVINMPHVTEGIFAKFIKDRERKIVFLDKKPEADKNSIGIEIEFFCKKTKNEIGTKLYDVGLGKNVTLKGDSSIIQPSGTHSHELCVIANDVEYNLILKKVCDLLKDIGAQVNKTCGLHIHLDMRNRSVGASYKALVLSQDLLYKMNPKSRSEKYAKKNEIMSFEEISTDDRRFGINTLSYNKHSSLEVRIHSGTVEFVKISNWIEILLKIVKNSEKINKKCSSLEEFKNIFEVEDKILLNYIESRIEKFQIGDDVEIGVA